MEVLKVTWHALKEACALIRPYHLYASDALHFATAMMTKARLLVDAYHFTRLREKNSTPTILPITAPLNAIKEAIEKH